MEESEELKKYREKRIKEFVWLMENIVVTRRFLKETNDPIGSLLLKKLNKELQSFLKETKDDKNETSCLN